VINVRLARAGEKFKALDESELALDGSELVICDAERPVALAGVMGGLDSGVNDQTRDVFVEAAYFLPSAVRRASRRHGMDSDSCYRFSRGVDPDSVLIGLNRACQLLAELAGGSICADFYDIYPRPVVRPRIELDLKFISARLGVTYDAPEARRLLERVGCDVSGSGDKLLVNPPAFRGDLRLPEDLGEELLRLRGFAQIPETLPRMTSEPTPDVTSYLLQQKLSDSIRSYGYSQAVNLAFTSSVFEPQFLGTERGQASELGLDLKLEPVKLVNPLNLDLNDMRSALLPGLVRNAAFNYRHGNLSGALFEVGRVFFKKEVDDLRGEKRPFSEQERLAFVSWGEPAAHWVKGATPQLFFQLKGHLENILRDWQFKSFKFEKLKTTPSFLHPGKSARLVVEGKPVGFIGILHPLTSKLLDLKTECVVAELNLDTLLVGQPRALRIKALPKFPSVSRDVALLVKADTAVGDIKQELSKAGGSLVVGCEVFDVFSDAKLGEGLKSVALRLTYQDPAKTLLDDEINALHQKAVEAVSKKLSATVR
jgi:phenylalanyl-tRNA synthetase beta chain